MNLIILVRFSRDFHKIQKYIFITFLDLYSFLLTLIYFWLRRPTWNLEKEKYLFLRIQFRTSSGPGFVVNLGSVRIMPVHSWDSNWWENLLPWETYSPYFSAESPAFCRSRLWKMAAGSGDGKVKIQVVDLNISVAPAPLPPTSQRPVQAKWIWPS